jgi:hypothetical protein
MAKSDVQEYLKGKEFEDFVTSMFPSRDFEILQKADLEGSKLPDLHLKDLRSRDKFWVEAK